MGFNPGSTLGAMDLRISVVAINTNLAAIAGSATAMLFWYLKFGKPDITMACNGMLAGLSFRNSPRNRRVNDAPLEYEYGGKSQAHR
jgi:ammonium transporter, Amt family